MLAPYSKIPVVPVAIGFMTGILLFGAVSWLWIVLLVTVSAVLLYKHDRFYTFGMLAVAAGWLSADWNTPLPFPVYLHGEKTAVGGSIARIEGREDAVRFLVDVDSLAGDALSDRMRIWLSVPGGVENASIGARIHAVGYIRDVTKSDGLPYEPDYASFAKVDAVVATMTSAGNQTVIYGEGHGFREAMRRHRQRLTDAIYLSGLGPASADFIVATVCGDDVYMLPHTYDTFRSLGLAHLLALSGFHVALFAAMAAMALYPLRLSRRFARIRHIFVIAAVWLYVMLTGSSVSAIRAAMLLSIVLGGHLMQRASTGYNALAAAALLMLAYNPMTIYSPGFQMSFAAVLGLLAFADRLNPFTRRRIWPYRIAALVCVPLAAMTGTALISVCYFHSFPLLFLPANIVAGILASPLICGGFVVAGAGLAGAKLPFLTWMVDRGYGLLDSFCGLMMKIPHHEITDIYPAGLTVICFGAAIIAFAVALNMRRRIPAILGVAAVFAGLGVQRLEAEDVPSGELYVVAGRSDTRIVMRHGDTAALLTESRGPIAAAERSWSETRYAAWLSARGCVGGLMDIDSLDAGGCLGLNGSLLHAGPYCVAIIRRMSDCVRIPVDYVVVSQGGDIDFSEIAAVMRPRQVILGGRLHRKRRQAYEEACRRYGLAVHNAADSTFRLVW